MTRPCKIGVQLPEVERHVPWAEQLAIARAVEAVGFDSVWVGDHLLYDRPDGERVGPWEAWSQLAGLAVGTERVEIGPLVAATAFHAPAMLAKKAATIDEMSGGRLILGLGAGWNRSDFDPYGFPYDHRASRFEEAFGIIRRLLRGEVVDHDGEYYSVAAGQILPPGPRASGPPLMIGSMGDRMLAATMPVVDLWNGWWAWFGNSPDGLRPILEKVDQACEAAGRDPRAVGRSVAVLVQLPGGAGREMGRSNDGYSAAPSPAITGSPDQIAAGLASFAALGIEHLQLVLDPITVASVEAMGEVLAVLDN